MKVLPRGNSAALQRALDRAATLTPSWAGDPDRDTFPGYHVDLYRRRIGGDDHAFTVAVETVLTWGVQRGAGLAVHAASSRVATGVDVIVGLPVGPAVILAPCRVSEVFDSAVKGGFRYVTLPGHPETGFEEFIVERSANGEVWFVVRPVSRPGSVLTRLAAPLSRAIQRRAGQRYLDAVCPG